MKIKVFENGQYPQGNFTAENVKKIFGNVTKPIKAIFSHTSKWNDKEPVEVGTFNSFEVKEENGKVIAYGNVDFNENGTKYHKDGILKGVSVEVDKQKDELLRVAVLPVGINPQISGAEFQEEDMLVTSFEEITEEPKQQTKEEILASLTIDDIITRFGEDYSIVKKEEPKPAKTEEEIRAEIKSEFEEKARLEKERVKFLEKYKDKITPSIREFMTDDVITCILSNSSIVEFGEIKVNLLDIIDKLMFALPDFIRDTVFNDTTLQFSEEDDEITKITKQVKAEYLNRKK